VFLHDFVGKVYLKGMKKYVPYIIGIVVLFVLVYLGQGVMKNRETVKNEENNISSASALVEGTVTRFFEGEQVLGYAFSIPETATTSSDLDGALVKVTNDATLVVATYFSYEGGRGYSPADYVTNVIAPRVALAAVTGTTTLGGYDFTVVEGVKSIWYIASVKDSQWLVVAEADKDDQDGAKTILESLTVN
jgi:hypothetical protein